LCCIFLLTAIKSQFERVVYFVESDALLQSSFMIAQNEKGAGSWEVRDLLSTLVYIVSLRCDGPPPSGIVDALGGFYQKSLAPCVKRLRERATMTNDESLAVNQQ
jgi:hypothetical protein